MSNNGDEKPDLVVPDRSLVSIDQARAELEAKKAPRTTGVTGDFVTRKEMVKIVDKIGVGISDAAYAMGQKVFDQITEETVDLLEQQEHILRQEIRALREEVKAEWLAREEARSWSGRVRAFKALVHERLTQLDKNIQQLDDETVVHEHK